MLFTKLKRIRSILPYSPVSLDSSYRSLWVESLKKGKSKFRIAYKFSEVYTKALKLLGLKFTKITPQIFGYEIEHLEKSNLLYQFESIHLFSGGSEEHKKIVNNKLEFYFFCKKNNFPTPEVYGTVHHNIIVFFSDKNPWEQNIAFMVKPASGSQSKGILDFRKIGETENYKIYEEQREIDKKYISEYLKYFLPRKQPFLIQEKVKPAQFYIDRGILNVPIIRILSIKEGAEIKIINPVLIVNPNTGYLNTHLKNKKFYKINYLLGSIESLISFTNFEERDELELEGERIPFWNEIISTTIRMHSQLSTIRVLGWDIAVSGDSFFIMETNKNPWIEVHQKGEGNLLLDVLLNNSL